MFAKRIAKTNQVQPAQDLMVAEMSPAAREALRSYTPARLGLERTGVSLATRPLLDFQLAHARARDAVHAAIDMRMVCDELRPEYLSPAA
jgi:ethanolamine ammonia-lyase small subunit